MNSSSNAALSCVVNSPKMVAVYSLSWNTWLDVTSWSQKASEWTLNGTSSQHQYGYNSCLKWQVHPKKFKFSQFLLKSREVFYKRPQKFSRVSEKLWTTKTFKNWLSIVPRAFYFKFILYEKKKKKKKKKKEIPLKITLLVDLHKRSFALVWL